MALLRRQRDARLDCGPDEDPTRAAPTSVAPASPESARGQADKQPLPFGEQLRDIELRFGLASTERTRGRASSASPGHRAPATCSILGPRGSAQIVLPLRDQDRGLAERAMTRRRTAHW